MGVSVPLLRRVRRGLGPRGPRAAPARLRRAAELTLTAVALAIPAALLAGVTGWWHTSAPGWVFLAALVGALAVGVGVSVFAAPRRHTLGPTAVAAGLAATVVLIDVLTGARLQLNGVGGYSALEGARSPGSARSGSACSAPACCSPPGASRSACPGAGGPCAWRGWAASASWWSARRTWARTRPGPSRSPPASAWPPR
ncbi:hypothetical protein ACFQX7_02420 [Luedemannella flava]